MRGPRRLSPAAVTAAFLLLGCGGEEFAFEAGDDVARSGSAELESVELESAELPRGRGQAIDSLTPNMIIRTGRARVEVESLSPAVEALQQLASAVGGYTTNVTLRTGREQAPRATVELRVPAARFDSAIAALSDLGDVEAVAVTADDVGEEYVDVQARVANDRRLEQRLLSLLAERTGDLEDVLAVERELARVRGTIERQEGRLRYLRNRAAMSTLAVTLHEPTPLFASQRGENVIAGAFRGAWRTFVLVIAAMIVSLGAVIPLGGLAAVVWLAIRRLRRTPRA